MLKVVRRKEEERRARDDSGLASMVLSAVGEDGVYNARSRWFC